jgi:hypothetical protein
LTGKFDRIVSYRPAPLANRTAQFYKEASGYKSEFAQSKTDYEHGSSKGESEQRIPLNPGYAAKRVPRAQVTVQADGYYYPTEAERLDWRDFPEFKRRQEIKSPDVPTLPPASLQSRPSRYAMTSPALTYAPGGGQLFLGGDEETAL